jgi:hypothetical protein
MKSTVAGESLPAMTSQRPRLALQPGPWWRELDLSTTLVGSWMALAGSAQSSGLRPATAIHGNRRLLGSGSVGGQYEGQLGARG